MIREYFFEPGMTTSGRAFFFDGVTCYRRVPSLEVTAAHVRIRSRASGLPAEWAALARIRGPALPIDSRPT
jgi:hypothetical protein